MIERAGSDTADALCPLCKYPMTRRVCTYRQRSMWFLFNSVLSLYSNIKSQSKKRNIIIPICSLVSLLNFPFIFKQQLCLSCSLYSSLSSHTYSYYTCSLGWHSLLSGWCLWTTNTNNSHGHGHTLCQGTRTFPGGQLMHTHACLGKGC